MAKKVNRLNLLAGVSSFKVEDVPLAPGVDVSAIQAGDTNPMEVVVEVPAGKSKRGWNYKPQALKDIVTHVMSNTLNGFLGHQKPENVSTEFPQIQTHWVGASYDEGSNKAYFRGVLDPDAKSLKRWVKSGRIKQVSIFGRPKLQQASGETEVVGYDPLSIDWTPLDRPGMPTQVVAVGEMASVYDGFELDFDGEIEPVEVSGELDGSFEGTSEAVRSALREHFGKDSYVYLRRTYDKFAIANVESNKVGSVTTKMLKVSYGIVDGKVVLGDMTEVNVVETYVPVGEQSGGEQTMKKEELLAALKASIAAGELNQADLSPVLGEMFAAETLSGEMTAAIGDHSAADVTAALALKAKNDQDEAAKAIGEMVQSLVGEKVKGKDAQDFVTDAFIPQGTTKEAISGELDAYLAKPNIKSALEKLGAVHSVFHRGNDSGTTTGTRTKRVPV